MRPEPRLSWTFAITSLALFAFALDRLVVTIALPAIRTELGAQVADLEWTVNAYTLSFAVLLLTGAALGDRFGRRRMFTIGVAVFTAGSAIAALAPTIGALVAARAVQGVGGAMFMPLTLTMLSAVTPAARRGAVLGAWGGIGGLGAAIGPLVGGALTGGIGWRAIFWLNVPLGIVVIVLARRRLAETYGPRRKLDLAGVVLGSAGLFGVVWAVVRAGAKGWASPEVSFALSGGIVVLMLFVGWEIRTPTPMLPMRFFRNRVFAAGGLASLMMYSALFGTLFLITQLMQIGLGATPLQAGLRTLPMAVMPMLIAPVGGVVADRVGFRPLMICGTGIRGDRAGLAGRRRDADGVLRLAGRTSRPGRNGQCVVLCPAGQRDAVRSRTRGARAGVRSRDRDSRVGCRVRSRRARPGFRRARRVYVARRFRRRFRPRGVAGRRPGGGGRGRRDRVAPRRRAGAPDD